MRVYFWKYRKTNLTIDWLWTVSEWCKPISEADKSLSTRRVSRTVEPSCLSLTRPSGAEDLTAVVEAINRSCPEELLEERTVRRLGWEPSPVRLTVQVTAGNRVYGGARNLLTRIVTRVRWQLLSIVICLRPDEPFGSLSDEPESPGASRTQEGS